MNDGFLIVSYFLWVLLKSWLIHKIKCILEKFYDLVELGYSGKFPDSQKVPEKEL